MELRLEGILLVGIIGIAVGVMSLELNDKNRDSSKLAKELEFTNTTFVEVDTIKRAGELYGTYGIRYQGTLNMQNIIYHTDNIESLVSKKGRYKDNILYLDGDVVMIEQDGYIYNTQHAIYNQTTQILNIISPYTAIRDKNIMNGDTLVYDTAIKYASGQRVDAVFYTAKK